MNAAEQKLLDDVAALGAADVWLLRQSNEQYGERFGLWFMHDGERVAHCVSYRDYTDADHDIVLFALFDWARDKLDPEWLKRELAA